MNDLGLYMSCFTILMLFVMLVYILLQKNKKQLHYVFLLIVIEVFIWAGAVVARGLSASNPQMLVFWENITYIGAGMVPVCLILLARAYSGKILTK